MTKAEEMANRICALNFCEIEGVEGIEYPIDLNAFIIVMDSGKRYLVEVSDCLEDKEY